MAEGGGGSGLQDDELYLPRTVVNKLIKEIVPNIRVTNDARDLLLNCCTEFIHLIASEASDISENQQKKVISPEHVVEALNTLGFQEYVADVEAVHKEYKEQASKHRKRGKSKLDRLGIPEEELLRQQQQLFEEARQQQMESELLEHQRAQQLQQQQLQPVQSQQLPQQVPLPPQQTLPQPSQAPTHLPHPTSVHPQLPQVPLQVGVAATPPSSNQVAVLSQAPAPLAVSSALQMVPPQTGAPDVKLAPSGPVPVGGGGGEAKVKEGVPQVQRSIPQPAAAQSINTAGLNMLAAVGAMQQQERQQQQQQVATVGTPQQSTAPKAPQPILPNNAAITVASLQASLLQQALAMASAQVAANNTAQQQRPPVTSGAPTSVLGGAAGSMLPLPQSLLLQQQALAALAAQQAQIGSQLGQPTSLSSQSNLPPTLATTTLASVGGGGADMKGQQGQAGSGSESASEQLDYKPFPPT